MAYEVQVMDVAAGPLATMQGRATQGDLPAKIRMLFDQLYGELGKGLVKKYGHNVVLYWGAPGINLLAAPEGCSIEAGVQVAAPFENGGELTCSATPAGTVAASAHFGPYDQMGKAYDAIFAWCADNGRHPAGPFWELYGDWEDDPAKLRTDVFILLA